MVPASDKAVMGPPDHGGMSRRILWSPFQGLPGIYEYRYPLAHKFQYGGGCDVLMLDRDYDKVVCGIRWI